MLTSMNIVRNCVRLTRRARPNEIELRKIKRRFERVGLDEPKRVARLRLYIDADHVKARAAQPHARAARATEKIKRAQCHFPPRSEIILSADSIKIPIFAFSKIQAKFSRVQLSPTY